MHTVVGAFPRATPCLSASLHLAAFSSLSSILFGTFVRLTHEIRGNPRKIALSLTRETETVSEKDREILESLEVAKYSSVTRINVASVFHQSVDIYGSV